jgi:hypothetical protein
LRFLNWAFKRIKWPPNSPLMKGTWNSGGPL